jgi:AraC-like DNA-binding protein
MLQEKKTQQDLLDELATMRQKMARMSQRISELEMGSGDDRSLPLLRFSMEGVLESDALEFFPTTLSRSTDKFSFPQHPQLRSIFAFIDTHYNEAIGLTEIAKTFGYTPSYLTSLVRRLTGKTLYQWIVQRRMFAARCLLLETNLSVTEVADRVGYPDTGHFIKHFRQIHGQPPKQFKTQNLQIQSYLPVA